MMRDEGCRCPTREPPLRRRPPPAQSLVARLLGAAPAVTPIPKALPPLSRMQRIRLRARRFPLRLAGIASAATLILLIPLSVHCYNVLIRRYYDALAAHARVEVLLQRRDDLTRNLERVVSAVRTHEATLFADVTTKRANAHDGAPKSTPTPMGILPLDRLLAVSEQYPVERLSEDVQPVTQALVEVERDLGIARQRSVEATNMYLHRVHTFPGNLYAWVFGFRALPFFEAAPEAGRLRPGQF